MNSEEDKGAVKKMRKLLVIKGGIRNDEKVIVHNDDRSLSFLCNRWRPRDC
jgi:hypothetical protein